MTKDEILGIARVQSDRFGNARLVPLSELRPIETDMAKELYSIGVPICFQECDEYIVATYDNPFEYNYNWFAWVE